MSDDEVQLPPILLPGHEKRQQARAIIGLTVGLLVAMWFFIFFATPGSFGPEPELSSTMPLLGIGMQVVGVAWMVRIYRSALDVEPDQGNWRFRSR